MNGIIDMQKVKTFIERYNVADMDNAINEWISRNNVKVINCTVSINDRNIMIQTILYENRKTK